MLLVFVRNACEQHSLRVPWHVALLQFLIPRVIKEQSLLRYLISKPVTSSPEVLVTKTTTELASREAHAQNQQLITHDSIPFWGVFGNLGNPEPTENRHAGSLYTELLNETKCDIRGGFFRGLKWCKTNSDYTESTEL